VHVEKPEGVLDRSGLADADAPFVAPQLVYQVDDRCAVDRLDRPDQKIRPDEFSYGDLCVANSKYCTWIVQVVHVLPR
jgi:hypothetical protein